MTVRDQASSDENATGTCETFDTPVTQGRSGSVHDLPKGFTYFVRDGDLIKIGSSMKPHERFKTLQRETPNTLEVLAIVPQEIVDEFETHQRFAQLRVRKELFRPEPDLMAFIASLPPGVAPPSPESKGAMAALKAKGDSQGRPHLFDSPIDIRRSLIAKRQAAGAKTPIGFTCSNIVEQLDGLSDYERPAWAVDVRQTLPWLMNQQIERLAALSVSQKPINAEDRGSP